MKETPLKEVCIITMGQAPPGTSYNQQGLGIPLIAGAGDFGELSPQAKKFTTEATKISQPGDLILCIRATIGDCNWSDQHYCLGRGVAGLHAKDNLLDSNYLWYWLKIAKNQLLNLAKGSTFKQVSQEAIASLKIPLPPLEEQQRIAAILDKADDIRRKRKQAIALTEELLRSTFLDMFGDPVTNPKGWDKRKFKDIFKSIRYGTSTPPQFENDGIPFIRATNIKNGTVSINDLRFISLDESNKIEKCKLKKGDIVIVRSGVNSGDSALITQEYEGSYAGYDMIIDIDEFLSIFYNFIINSEFGKQMIKPLTRRAGQPHINADQVKNLEFIYPSKISIEKFNLFWHQVQLKINKYQKFQQQSDNLFNSLLQKAFKGEL